MPELPSGTVTFLFTDIEGSTALWEADRVAMAEAVDHHLALLRAAIEVNHGAPFKTVGDAVQAAFPTAPDAVAAALEAQKSLLADTWSGVDRPLSVRMALHTVAAEPRNGDYLAPGLNRLARLLAAAHGGQILVSLATQELALDALPLGTSLRDLGEHSLRDLYRPGRVFQLLHPDLTADFPPIRTLATRPNNLSVQPTPFLGREEHVTRTVDFLLRDEVRLLTITGPGGVGKTRLALQAAADLLESMPDGVWFVDLSVLTDPGLVPSAITNVLGLREEGKDLTERLADELAGKDLLLVLDSFERVVEAASVVADLLSRTTGVKVLATSRTPLHAYGEREYPLPPMALPDPTELPSLEQLTQYEAVRLFGERAQAVKPDFVVNDANAPAVAEICARLEGLPLALELAAARVKVLPPSALLTRLEPRLPVLTGGARTLPARQQTMRAAIAWSHDLLSPVGQTLFRRLAVFPGGCSIDAAEAVVNPEGMLEVFSAIALLVDMSLLRQEEGGEGEARFRMLETVREYAGERLAASGEESQLWRGHLSYLLRFVTANDLAERPLSGPDHEARLARLGTEESNLRAGLEWGLLNDPETALATNAGLGLFWYAKGRVASGLDLLERLLMTGAGENTSVRARALVSAAMLAINLGDSTRAQALADAGFALAERLGEGSIAARARYRQGRITMVRGDWDRATMLLQDALNRLEQLGDTWGVAACLNDLGVLAFNQGDATAAVGHLERYLAIAEAQQSDRSRATALANLAWAHYYSGHHEVALDLSTQALSLSKQIASSQLRASCLGLHGWLALKRGDLAQAATYAKDSLEPWWDLGAKRNLAPALERATAIMVAAGRAEAAARLYGAVEVLREEIGSPRGVLEQKVNDQDVATLRAALNEATVTRLWAEGRNRPLATAVSEALATLEVIGHQFGTSAIGLLAANHGTTSK